MKLYTINGNAINIENSGSASTSNNSKSNKERYSFVANKYLKTASVGSVCGCWDGSKITATSAYNGECYSITDCVENDIFRVRGLGSSSRPVYAFVDENYVVLELTNSVEWFDGWAIAPENAAHIIVHSKASAQGTIFTKNNEMKEDTFCLTKNVMNQFMRSVIYDGNDDFATSKINSFFTSINSNEDEPIPVKLKIDKVASAVGYKIDIYDTPKHDGNIIKSVTTTNDIVSIYNLIPNRIYWYSQSYTTDNETYTVQYNDEFATEGEVRTIYAYGETDNVRDVGGYRASNNRRVKYGIMFRNRVFGSSISDKAKSVYLDDLGILSDVDIRTVSESGGITESPLGSTVEYNLYDVANKGYADALKKIYDNVINNKPMLVHCSAGADRTGLIYTYILALLGVSESDIRKDYELTSYSGVGVRLSNGSNTASAAYPNQFRTLKAFSGDTLQDKAKAFFKSVGFTDDEILKFIDSATE